MVLGLQFISNPYTFKPDWEVSLYHSVCVGVHDLTKVDSAITLALSMSLTSALSPAIGTESLVSIFSIYLAETPLG